MEFIGFPKIPRLFRDIVITEKIDGTNGQVFIEHVPTQAAMRATSYDMIKWCDDKIIFASDEWTLRVGSHTRWITPQNDNYGFACWARDNVNELLKLGAGHHFGEWWGQGIQRNYGLKEKRFSLFNVSKWGDANVRPLCCDVVPVLWAGNFDMAYVRAVLEDLKTSGSKAAPGFMKPEGIVVYHTRGNNLFKVTIENDERGKAQ